MKQLLPCFLSHLWVDCKEAADGADGRAECGKRGTSWRPSRYRYRKSATAVRRVTDVPTVLPSLRFSISCPVRAPAAVASKVCALSGRTLYTVKIEVFHHAVFFSIPAFRISQFSLTLRTRTRAWRSHLTHVTPDTTTQTTP